jgi:hypothetical protein
VRVETDAGEVIELGTTETAPTIGITDYSRRVTDDFGVTTVVKRGFARRMSVRLAAPFEDVDAIQRRLATLRAQPALWVADERYGSLKVRGLYNDFSFDIAAPPLSYCTLTIEGLLESDALIDSGGDPAPGDQVSTLQVLQPVAITGPALVSSSVSETEHAEWSAGTTYPAGARVIRAASHRVYESAGGGNLGNDPAGTGGKWVDIGPTKRWAMFDQALGTATTSNAPIEITLQPGTAITSLAVLDTNAATVRVRAPGYDRTQAVIEGAGSALFLDLDAAAGASVTVTFTPTGTTPSARPWDDGARWSDVSSWRDAIPAGDGTVSVGTMLIGSLKPLGVTEASPTAGITDYSRKDTDDFGEVTIVERAWAKRMTAKALIRTDAIDDVAHRIAAVRAVPSLWIGEAELDSLTIYGFFKDYSIEVGETLSKLSLSIEGLSKAAPIAPAPVVLVPRGLYDAAVIYGPGDVVQYQGSSWTYIAAAASSGNAPPSLPTEENAFWRVFARAGADGADGRDGRDGLNGTNGAPGAPGENGQPSYLHIAYANSANGQVDFTTGAPGNRTYLGVLVDQVSSDSNSPGAYVWSLIKGVDGLNGANGTPGAPGADGKPSYVHIAYANSANGSADFSVDNPVGRGYVGFYTDQTLTDSTNPAAYAWSLVKGADGAAGLNGTNGAPGAPGANGQTSYVHVAYADSADGASSFTTGAPGARKYIGILTDFSVADSANYADYTWSKLTGDNGLNGANGTAGPAGADGQPSYVHFAYANSANGSVDFHVSDPAGRAYIGIYTDATLADSTNPAAYTWSLVKGADGKDGLNGTNGLDGKNGQSIHIAYADSADGTVNFTVGDAGGRTFIGVYTDTNPGADSPNPASYGWTRLRGLDGTNGLAGPGGYVHTAYANSANGTVDFHLFDPTGRAYLGVYSDQTLADSANPAAYAWSLIKGADGKDGLNGTNGAPGAAGANGSTSYFHTAFANSPTGLIDFTSGAPNGHAFIGTYSDFTAADSENPAAYTWTAYKGPASFGLTGRGDVTVASNSLVKTATSGLGDAAGGGFSTEGWIGGAQASFKLASVETACGLNTDPSSNDSYTSIDYAFLCSANGNTYIFESGSIMQAIGGNDPTRTFQIVYDNARVRYLINGIVVREIAAASGLTLYLDAALGGLPGYKITDISYSSAGSAGPTGAAASNLTASVSSLTFAADYLGNLKSGQLAQVIVLTFTEGSTNVSTNVDWTVPEFSGCAGSMTSSGLITFTSVAASGYVRVTGTYKGQAFTVKVPITLAKDAPPANSDQQASAGLSGFVSSNSYAGAPVATVIAAIPSGILRAQFNISYSPDDRGNVYLEGMAAYRRAGTADAWSFLPAVQGSQGRIGGTTSEPINEQGAASANQTVSVTAGRWEVGFFVRRYQGSLNGYFDGTLRGGNG